MMTVHIRKQGGAAIMTIPSDVLRMMHIDVGATLELSLTKQGLLARPISTKKNKRKRYTLSELLQGCTKENLKALKKKTQWAREGKSLGREIP